MIELPDNAPKNVLLLGIAGSTAFGLAHENSDIDLHGVFCAPIENILGLDKVNESYNSTKPDVQLHEIGKFIRLALKCNPTILETLYLNNYIIKTTEGSLLIENRAQLLSTKYVRDAYTGYALSQFGRENAFPTPKAARHAVRILDAGYSLLTTGTMSVDRSADREKLFALGELSQSDYAAFRQEFRTRADALANAESVLPDKPNVDLFNELLIELRRRTWQN